MSYYSIGKWISLAMDFDNIDVSTCMKKAPDDYCSITLQIMWFEINWWALGTAGYGAVEFRWSKYWS